MIYVIIVDIIIGDPSWIYHPVIIIGNLIKWLEFHLYEDSRVRGLVFFSCVFIIVGFFTFIIELFIKQYVILHILILSTALATHSLIKESYKVVKGLKRDINEGRKMLSYIVGRETESLSVNQIYKATIETVAENTIDGIIAPIFYMYIGTLFGFPLVFAYLYKTVNTLDSMVGYKNDKYLSFGWFSAKADDLFNFVPARLGSILMLLSGVFVGDLVRGFKIFIRDRLNHSSPNAGHPESVIAGLFGIKLGGDSTYFGKVVRKPSIGDDIQEVNVYHLYKTYVVVLITVCIIMLILGVLS
jgi:adenosylcobinamide-phosphate synthase